MRRAFPKTLSITLRQNLWLKASRDKTEMANASRT